MKKDPGPNGIKNIPLVLVMIINFTRDWNDIACEPTEECSWINSIIRVASTNGIEVTGPYKFWESNEKYFELDEEDEEDDKGRTLSEWRREVRGPFPLSLERREILTLHLQFKDYVSNHAKQNGKIGGNHYDITKFSKAEKRQYTYM